MNTHGGLHNTAYYLKGKGRGKDTELVHMTPSEIKGLQALALAHGGSLTINPSTGLPEAGFLEDILPVVAAAGLTYLTAGAATPYLMSAGLGATSAGIVAGAGAGAAISGGMAAIQGKDVGQAALMGGIGGGIAGGMGAYGDANVFGVGVPDAATQATQTAGIEAASTLNPQAGGFQQVAGDQLIPTEQGNLLLPGGSAQSSVNIGPNIPEQFAQGTASTFVPPSSSAPSSYYSQLGSGAMDTAKKIGIQALPGIGALQADQNMPGEQEDEYTRRLKGYRLSPNYKAYEAPRPNPYYRPSYAAEGGVMSSFDDEAGSDTVGMARGGIYTDEDPDTRYKDALSASMIRLGKAGQVAGIKPKPLPKMSISGIGDVSGAFPKEAASGGIMSNLGGYSDGGRMLKGPGDGMSDSIPGVIGGKQPARLADGEFVVPADVVSHLGNGSTDAGAKKLYSMMDKIRQARTGKKKQAPEINAEKYLPIKKKASGGITGYAEGGVARYNDGGPLATNIQNAYNAGYSGSQIGAALIAEGVTQAQAAAATGLSADVIAQVYAGGAAWNASGNPIGNPEGPARNTAATPVTPVTPVTPAPVQNAVNAAPSRPGMPDFAVKAAVIDMMNSGVSGSQIGRTLLDMGVSQAQAVQATGLGADIIAQSYAGGAKLPAGTSAAGLPTRPALDASGNPIIPRFSNEATAAYLRDNQLTTKDQQEAAFRMFNIGKEQQEAALALLNSTDPAVKARIQAETDKYIAAVKANPNAAIQNALTTYYRREDLGLPQVMPPVVPKPVVPKVPGQPETPDMPATFAGSTVYRPNFVPRVSGISMSPTMQDPYSNEGLAALYSQMMGQYAKPAPQPSDADVRGIVQRYVGNGAEVGRQLINAGVPVKQAISALKAYPQITPDIVNQAYIGGQALGTTPPPTLNTQYNYSDPATYYRPPSPDNLVLTRPIVDAAFTPPAPTPANTALFAAPNGQMYASQAAYNAAVGN